jgi:hypothetical protein
MKKILLFLAVSIIFFSNAGCIKNILSRKNGYAEFYLNGEFWKASDKNCSDVFPTATKRVGAIYHEGASFQRGVQIEFGTCFRPFDRPSPDSWVVRIKIMKLPTPGTYVCNQKSPPNNSNTAVISIASERNPFKGGYSTSEFATGTLTILKADTGANKPANISGTFECKMKNISDKNDSINITKGSFHIFNRVP